MDQDRFSKRVIEIVAKRAANICTNPDCQALTAGPADEPSRTISVGEAAHIYGVRPGSARHRADMPEGQRGDVTNAIWLCCTCHKIIDSDPVQFPAELLFEWKRDHDRVIGEKLGKTGPLLREKATKRVLEPFSNSSYLAQQIVIDKPEFWEYKLMSELLRTMAVPVIQRSRSLAHGFYSKPSTIVPLSEMAGWMQARNDEVVRLVDAIGGLMNGEMQASWGPPGQPGSETEILRVCGLFAECCESLLKWEESVRFAHLPSAFKDYQDLLSGVGCRLLEQIAALPAHFEEIFSRDDPSGVHELEIVLDLPEGWVEQIELALERATDRIINDGDTT